MRPITLLFIALLWLIAACKKVSPDCIDADIEGTWELRELVADYSADYPPGSGNLLKLTKNEYEIYYSDTLYRKGSYLIVPDKTAAETICRSVPAGEFSRRIIYDGDMNSMHKEFFQITLNTMKIIFGAGCSVLDADGQRFYVRK